MVCLTPHTSATTNTAQIWPSTLANAALFQTLHSGANPIADGWRVSRYRFFLYIFIGSFCWYWLPGYIFTGLSTFAFICWAAPGMTTAFHQQSLLISGVDNKVLNNLFGMTTGLGYLPTTFDWSQIAYNTSPLVIPFWAQANVFAGWFCVYAVVAPILYYTNTWFTAYLPLTGSDAYDNTGSIYDSSRILDDTGAIDEAKYREYSPIFLPITFALSYGLGFAVLSCLLTHVVLNHSKDILNTFRGQSKKDIHARLISHYPDVPWWWYGILTVRMNSYSQLSNHLAYLTCADYHRRRVDLDAVCLAHRASFLGRFHHPCFGCSLCDPCGHCVCRCELE